MRMSVDYCNVGHGAGASAYPAAGACVRGGETLRVDAVFLESGIYNRSLQPSTAAARYYIVRRCREVVLLYGCGYEDYMCRGGVDLGTPYRIAVDIETGEADVCIGHLNRICRPRRPSALGYDTAPHLGRIAGVIAAGSHHVVRHLGGSVNDGLTDVLDDYRRHAPAIYREHPYDASGGGFAASYVAVAMSRRYVKSSVAKRFGQRFGAIPRIAGAAEVQYHNVRLSVECCREEYKSSRLESFGQDNGILASSYGDLRGSEAVFLERGVLNILSAVAVLQLLNERLP